MQSDNGQYSLGQKLLNWGDGKITDNVESRVRSRYETLKNKSSNFPPR
jgi:hypothetical protein